MGKHPWLVAWDLGLSEHIRIGLEISRGQVFQPDVEPHLSLHSPPRRVCVRPPLPRAQPLSFQEEVWEECLVPHPRNVPSVGAMLKTKGVRLLCSIRSERGRASWPLGRLQFPGLEERGGGVPLHSAWFSPPDTLPAVDAELGSRAGPGGGHAGVRELTPPEGFCGAHALSV